MVSHTPNGNKARLEHGSRNTRRTLTQGHKHGQPATKKAKKVKKGRHPKLTRSEKRKLTRLYTYTELSTEDICEVLRRLTGKSISVRCAQNNIKEVLHTNRLVSARPRNRTECRLRIAHTPCYRQKRVGRKRRDQEARSKDRTETRSPSRLPIAGGLQGESENETPPFFSSIEMPLYPSMNEDETDFNRLGVFDSTAPLKELAKVPWNNENEPGALAGAHDTYLGFPNIEYPSEALEHVVASLEPELGYETLFLGSAASSPQTTRPESFTAGLIADESIWDQYVNYPLEPSNALDGISSWPAHADHHSALQASEALEPPSLQGFREADACITSIGVTLSFESPHSQRTSIPTQISKDPQRDVGKRTPGLETILEADTEIIKSTRRESWSPSLQSFTKRLSYSSSLISEIMTAFDHFSLSSKGTKRSSAAVSSLGPLDEIPCNGPRELNLDTIYSTKYPVELPGGFLEYGADGCTLSSWCHRCLELLASSLSTKWSHNARLDFSIQDCGGFSCLDILRLDRFNNTTLHVAAAIGADYKSLIGLIERGGNLNAVNTAGQTFLHVLDPHNLLKPEGHLPALLSHVSQLGFDFGKVDHQGVNVIQGLLQYSLPHTIVTKIFETLWDQVFPGTTLGGIPRDNLGRTWQSRLLHLAFEAREGDPERSKALNALFWDLSGDRSVSFRGGLAFDQCPVPGFDADYDQLESIVTQAYSQALAEDSYGRNGFHCLAETHLKPPRTIPTYIKATSTRNQLVSLRLQHRQSQCTRLLEAGVNPNAYDKAGNTPLLAFLHSSQTRTEGNQDDGETEFYVRTLANAGAYVNGRDRRGESALHVAIKLGIISATRVLIELGANLHARQKDGKGVVKLGLEAAQQIKGEKKVHKTLHIRIMACLNIARNRGAIDNPTFFQEWEAFPSGFERYQQTSNGLSFQLPEHRLKLPAKDRAQFPILVESGRWLAKYPVDGCNAG